MDWLASLKATIVFEYIDRDDAQVQQMLANRQDVFVDYNRENLRTILERLFVVAKEQELATGTRSLFWLKPRI